MNRLRQTWMSAGGRRQIGAGLLLAVFVFVLALAQDEALHRAVHAESDHVHHQCAVTLLQAGQVDVPAVAPVVLPAAAATYVVVGVETQFLTSVDLSLPPSCGPPARRA